MDPVLQLVSTMLHNITTPGGMAWSKDKKTFFFIDSKNSRVCTLTIYFYFILIFMYFYCVIVFKKYIFAGECIFV